MLDRLNDQLEIETFFPDLLISFNSSKKLEGLRKTFNRSGIKFLMDYQQETILTNILRN